ncbi:hypothetical protein PENSPDRAFT_266145 [Peniophora sp. CONT]|nr:hypothetical protein PENSPDRAFT_266145 [Peniophora sp. CONT]
MRAAGLGRQACAFPSAHTRKKSVGERRKKGNMYKGPEKGARGRKWSEERASPLSHLLHTSATKITATNTSTLAGQYKHRVSAPREPRQYGHDCLDKSNNNRYDERLNDILACGTISPVAHSSLLRKGCRVGLGRWLTMSRRLLQGGEATFRKEEQGPTDARSRTW